MNYYSRSIRFLTQNEHSFSELIEALAHEGFSVTLHKKSEKGVDDRNLIETDMCIVDSGQFCLKELSVYARIREHYSGPLVVLSNEMDDLMQVMLFEQGIDELIFLPVNPLLLLARIRALFRRDSAKNMPKSLMFNELEINGGVRRVSYKGRRLSLSSREFDLLWYLASNAYSTMDRDRLYQNVFGVEYNGYDRSIDMYISRIRLIIAENTDLPQIIKTVRGKGYLFCADCI